MLWSMPPVIAASKRWSTRPSTATLIAARPEAHAASVVKFGPRKLNRLAMRPAITLASSPGIVSSVISPKWARKCARVSSMMCSRCSALSAANDSVTLEVLEHLGELDPHVRLVVLLAADRVADDHRDVVGVDVPVGPARIDERRAGGADRPPLTVVHLVGDLRRDRQLPADRIPRVVADPAADRRVRLVRLGVVGREVQRRVPALGWDVADRVATPGDVRPERIGVEGVGHDRADAHHGNR